MKLLIDIIDWEYPYERRGYDPIICDLTQKNTFIGLYLEIANGVILELRAECGSIEEIQATQDLIKNVGRGKQISLSEETQNNLWLYHQGDECWAQFSSSNEEPFSYLMIDPIPHPEKFTLD